jgi:putative ABC transport system permease protein
MKRVLRYLRAKQFDSDLKAEIQAHLEEKIDEFIEDGLAPEAARTKALRQFGNRTQVRENSRRQWAYAPLDEIFQDLRYAVRILTRNPVFTTVSIFSLALGIGVNTIVFGAVDQVLLRSLPYSHPDRLFAVSSRSANHGTEPMQVSAADFYDWRDQSRSFEALSAYSNWPMNLTSVDEPRRLESELVSANLFSTLSVNAEIGRTFQSDEDQEKSPFVVVISHHLWRELGASPQVIGRTLTLNGTPATVVGVMPASFAFPSPDVDAWTPLSLSAKNRSNREGRWLSIIGRLNDSASERDAATEMDLISQRLAAVYPASDTGWSASLVPLMEQLIGKTRPILLILQTAALFLLLVTCANLANLLLAKGTSRMREIAVRAALGASRTRVFRQLLVESLVLATFGGSLGLALAIPGIELARRLGDGLIPRASEFHMDTSVAMFAVAATLATALVFGLAPAMHASRADLGAQISSGARGTPRNVERKRGLLISVEVGLASVLLIGAGLVGESMVRLLSTPTGLRPDHLLTLRLTLSHTQYPTNSAQIAFFDQVLARVKTLPGILAAGEISDTPLKGNNPTFEMVVEGSARRPTDPPVQAGLRMISAGYLQTAGIEILKGRDFSTDDRAGILPVAIINQAMSRRYWPGSDPIGRRVRIKEEQQWVTVVGLVPDVKHMGLKEDEGPVVYLPYRQKQQDWLAWTTLIVRTTGDPLAFAPAVREAIREVNKSQPVGEVGTLEQVLSRSTAIPRFATVIISVLSGIALLIAAVGTYGLLAYTIAQRFPELAIRLALGASSVEVSWLMLRQAMLRVFVGVVSGLFSGWFLARFLQSLLFGVQPHDPVIYAAVASVLVVTSLVAVLVPARRIFKINPAAALRAD